MYAILGTSGAGKTTLLSLLADEPTKNLDEDTANEIMKKGTVVDTEDITLEEKCVFAMMVLARMLRICKFHKKLIEKAAGTSYNIVRTVQINIDGLADKALEGAV